MPNDDADGALTAIGCPGCAGVLSERNEGRHDYVLYVCTVGHTYSLEDLLLAKEQQLEYGLWAAVSMLEHLDMICRRLLEHIGRGGVKIPRGNVEERLRQIDDNRRSIRALIARDGPLDLGLADDVRPA